MPTKPEQFDKTPALFFWVWGVSVLLALVPTIWPVLDIDAATLFAKDQPLSSAVNWWWVQLINLYVPAAFRVGIVLALAVWVYTTVRKKSRAIRLAMAFLVLAGILGPGALVNWGFKDHWQRARPYQVENFGGPQHFTRAAVPADQCEDNCSFVSGHVACGFFFTSLMLIHRRRIAWITIGTSSGLMIGFARMADMAHWFSDVLWAYPITLLASWAVWKVLLRTYGSAVSPESTVA